MKGLTEKELNAKALEVFESNPGIQEVHQSTDGQCFENQGNAINHQILLTKDGSHVRSVRASELSEKKADKGEGDDGKGGGGPAVGNKGFKMKELQEMAAAAELPEAEWSGFKSKAELTAYLTEKGVELK